VLVFALACERAEHAGSPAAAASARERVATSAHYVLRVLRVETCRTSGAAAPADSTRRIGVELSLEPTSDLQVPANPYYARLIDEQRQVHEATLGGCGAPLSPSLPRRGQPARGYVVFDVPRTSGQLTLTYAPELVDTPREEVSIVLGP
jgi:hypothetical protein